jgi:Fic family protein
LVNLQDIDIIFELRRYEMKSVYYKTNLSKDSMYESFYPTRLQDIKFDKFNKETLELLSAANYILGELNGLSKGINDVNQFIAAYVRKEALYSSQIEGTQATLEDIFSTTESSILNKDIEDVVNYVKAQNYGIKLLEEYPICNRYIRMIHKVLLNNTRGSKLNPGEYRQSQNWIGHSGSTLKNASYIPPNVLDMNECLAYLEKYINEDFDLDDLIKAALIHYQFETIHPFLDGNGRIGRILIILYLISRKKLKYPCLYLSYYLKKNQFEYYERMSIVRKNNDYIQWINFFLKGIIEMAKDSIECILILTTLRNEFKKLIKPSDYWLLEYLETTPIIDAKTTSITLNLDYSKVNRTIIRFVDLGILKITNTSKRNRTYIYEQYLNILKN